MNPIRKDSLTQRTLLNQNSFKTLLINLYFVYMNKWITNKTWIHLRNVSKSEWHSWENLISSAISELLFSILVHGRSNNLLSYIQTNHLKNLLLCIYGTIPDWWFNPDCLDFCHAALRHLRLHSAWCRGLGLNMIQNRKIRISGEKTLQGQRNPTGETFQVKSYYPACFSLPRTGEKEERGGWWGCYGSSRRGAGG